MSNSWVEVANVHPEVLGRLFQVIDEISVEHDWDEDVGELSITVGGVCIVFSANQEIMYNMRAEDDIRADSQRVANWYWRE